MKKDIKPYFICPYLKGSHEGALCIASNEFIKNINNIDIHMCMSRHYEACNIYHLSLRMSAMSNLSTIDIADTL